MNIKAVKTICATALVAITLSGCETLDPYTGETEKSKATKGALIGALRFCRWARLSDDWDLLNPMTGGSDDGPTHARSAAAISR